ncbi:MAG: iron chaperone [Christensenellales bacterium]|jgi:uncharacterized protein YdhG (YjbR/CyaY superfamily)
MKTFEGYLSHIDNVEHRARVEEVLEWVLKRFPDLTPRIAWNQPMFTHHGTFIIGFSVAKHHLAVAPERAGINRFLGEIEQAGYNHSNELVRIPWNSPVDFSLLKKIIEFNIEDKTGHSAFWRK